MVAKFVQAFAVEAISVTKYEFVIEIGEPIKVELSKPSDPALRTAPATAGPVLVPSTATEETVFVPEILPPLTTMPVTLVFPLFVEGS